MHDGVLFAYGFGDEIQALDAKTGDLLWHYTHQLEQGAAPNHKRGIALYGNNVYMGTSDAHVIAVDARTGKLVWDTEIADFTKRESVSAGPLIARGLVMIGTTGTGVGGVKGGPQIVGLDAETGVFMLLFLDLAYDERVREGRMRTQADLEEAIVHGAVKRIRPKMMTVTAMFMGLLPIMWSIGTGSDVMKRIAAPMVGGVFSSFLLELLVYPVVYFIWKWHWEVKQSPPP